MPTEAVNDACSRILDSMAFLSHRLTAGGSRCRVARSTPRLLFSATSTGVDEVHVVGRDGSGLRRLTHGTGGVREAPEGC